MTDESAAILAAAIEKLAAALSAGVHIHVHNHAPIPFFPNTVVSPSYRPDPMQPPFVVTCETKQQ